METKDWLIVCGGLVTAIATFLLSRRKAIFDEKKIAKKDEFDACQEILTQLSARVVDLETDNKKCMETTVELSRQLGEAIGRIDGLTTTITRLEGTIGKAGERAAVKAAELAVAGVDQSLEAKVVKAVDAKTEKPPT